MGEKGIEPPMVPMYVFYRHGLHILPTVATLPKLDDVVFLPKKKFFLLNHLMGQVRLELTVFVSRVKSPVPSPLGELTHIIW